MEIINQEIPEQMSDNMCRIEAAATLLEKTVAWLTERQASLAGDVQRIVATVEQNQDSRPREQELERKLAEAEEQIIALKAAVAQGEVRASAARRTLPTATVQLLSKQGLGELDHIDAGALDAALVGLSLEQRIAVKAQLLRAGSLS